MTARYLIRFDDLCPTMNWDVWESLEALLDRHGVRPIVAVVPDNRDESLSHGEANPGFWARVRSWQAKGWSIGLHGHQHLYRTRHPGILGLNPFSEFAGVAREEQDEKISRALAIFTAEGVRADVWVAPGHSFDWNTVSVLRAHGLRLISDGHFLYPRRDREGMIWVPQQIWRLRRMPTGVWTACYHHNEWSPADLEAFAAGLDRFRGAIIDLQALAREDAPRPFGNADALMSRAFLGIVRLKRLRRRLAA